MLWGLCGGLECAHDNILPFQSLRSLSIELWPVKRSTAWNNIAEVMCGGGLRPLHAPLLNTFSCNVFLHNTWPVNVRNLAITPFDDSSGMSLSETLRALGTMHHLERLQIEHTFKPESSSALRDLPWPALPNLQEADLKCDYGTLVHLCSRINPSKKMSVVVPRRSGSNKHDYTRQDFIEISRLCDILLSSSQGSVENSQGLDCTMAEQAFSFCTFHVKGRQGLGYRTTSFSCSWSRRTSVKRKPYTILSFPSFRKYSHIRLSIPDKQFRREPNMPFIINSFSGATTLEIDMSTLFSLLPNDKDNLHNFQSEDNTSVSTGLFPKLRRVHLQPTYSWKMKKDEEHATLLAFRRFLEQRRPHGLKNVSEILVY
ncbi:hypothetical protein CPC08DRAFT_765821 [Agrocybe pediades]|nr:hypothetical protein CPC08DRAFT_765821 [Agrocybe pediades]